MLYSKSILFLDDAFRKLANYVGPKSLYTIIDIHLLLKHIPYKYDMYIYIYIIYIYIHNCLEFVYYLNLYTTN